MARRPLLALLALPLALSFVAPIAPRALRAPARPERLGGVPREALGGGGSAESHGFSAGFEVILIYFDEILMKFDEI